GRQRLQRDHRQPQWPPMSLTFCIIKLETSQWCGKALRSLRVRQGVRNQSVARGRHHEVMAAGHDEQILLAVLLIDDRRSLAAGGENVTPQDLACLDVDRLDEIAAPVRSAVVFGYSMLWRPSSGGVYGPS